MYRIWVQLCGRIDNKVISYTCISEIEREVGFYKHDQWGLLALLDVTRVYRSSSSWGVITVSESLLPEAIINKGGTTLKVECT